MNSIKFFKTFFVFFILGLSFTSCGDDADEDNIEFTVYPGERVNNIAIGDLGSKVVENLGSDKVEFISPFSNGDVLFQVTYSNYDIQFIMEIGPESKGFEGLEINSIKFFGSFSGKTTENISIGSSLTEVQAAYGLADVDSWGSHAYDDIGIFLDYDDNDLVEAFTIYK